MTTLRWGILGASRFALGKMIPALQQSRYAEIAAIASRDPAKASVSYEQLLSDPSIDVIYNPLPNHLHVAWTIKALEAGKHVLCEKPIGLTAAEAQRLSEVSKRHPHLKVMEAFMYRFHPQWQRARQIVREGEIGTLRSIQSAFSFFNDDAGNIRNQAACGGGALLDIGCYGVSLARFLFEAEPVRVLGVLDFDPRFKTDRQVSGLLDFGNGTASFMASTQLAPYQRVTIFGEAGSFEIEMPFNPPPDQPSRLLLRRENGVNVISFDACNQYTLEVDAFSRAILDDSAVPAPLSDAAANMRVIDALFESNRLGTWIEVYRLGI